MRSSSCGTLRPPERDLIFLAAGTVTSCAMKQLWWSSFAVLVMACDGSNTRHLADAPDQSADAQPVDAPAGGSTGYAIVNVQGYTAPTSTTTLFPVFYDGSPYAPFVIDGPCVVFKPAAVTPSQVGAGDVTLTIGTQMLSIPAVANGRYGPVSTPSLLFTGGEAVHVHATGATAPVLDVTTTAPAAAVITQPATASTIQVDHTMPLTFTWTGGSGSLAVTMYDEIAALSMRCELPAAPGTGSIPVAALAHLPVGSTATLVLSTEGDGTSTPTGWTVDLAVLVEARYANGTLAEGSLQIN